MSAIPRSLIRLAVFAVTALASLVAVSQASPPSLLPWHQPEIMVVTLRPSYLPSKGHITLQEVATLTGGPLNDRRRAGALDLTDAPPTGEETRVTRQQVAFRLILAGFEPQRFRVEGEPIVRIGRAAPAVVTQVSATIPLTPLTPVPVNITPLSPPANNQATPGVFPATAVLDQTATSVPLPVVIKKRDVVTLVANVGLLRVTARAEAIEDGCQGQVIRLRNLDSSQTVTGRVVNRNIVEVDIEGSMP